MILIGGFVTSILLLIVVYAAFQFRFKRLPASLKPTRFYDLALMLSALVIVAVGIYSIIKVF